MALVPQYEKIKYECGRTITNKNKAECKLNITEEEAAGVISVKAFSYLLSAEFAGGEIKYGGRTVFTVVYSDGSSFKKTEAGVEFGYKFPVKGDENAKILYPEVRSYGAEIKIANGIVTAVCDICFSCVLSEECESEYLSSVTGAYLKTITCEYGVTVGRTNKEFKAEDEFDTNVLIGSVLTHTEKAYVTSCQCGIGSIICDGEIELSMTVLPLGSESEGTLLSKKIPFRFESEMPDAMPQNAVTAKAFVKGANLKVFADESKNKSTISAEITLSIIGAAHETVTFTPSTDAYSLENELKIDFSDKKTCVYTGTGYFDKKIETEISPELKEDEKIVCFTDVSLTGEECFINGKAVTVTGVAEIDAIISGGKPRGEKYAVPYEFSFETEGDAKFFGFEATDLSLDVTGNKTAVSFTVRTVYFTGRVNTVKIIKGVEEGACKKASTAAVSVCISSAGDDAWDVAKTLGTTESAIKELNSDLEFPLVNDERIVVYRELK